jgi:hypothetical protein
MDPRLADLCTHGYAPYTPTWGRAKQAGSNYLFVALPVRLLVLPAVCVWLSWSAAAESPQVPGSLANTIKMLMLNALL